MKIEILYYDPDKKNKRLGYFDFKVDYPNGKWEVFRNASHFGDGVRQWITLGACKRMDEWVPRYERSMNLNDLFKEVLTVLKDYLEKVEKEEANLFDANPEIPEEFR